MVDSFQLTREVRLSLTHQMAQMTQMDAEEGARLLFTLSRFSICEIWVICAIRVRCWVPRRSVQSACNRKTRNRRLLLCAAS